MIKIDKLPLEVVSENEKEINIMYGGLPFTISKEPMDFDGESRLFSFVGCDFPKFITDKFHDNVFYDLTIKLSDGIAEFVSAEYWEDGKYHVGKVERHDEKVFFDLIANFPTLREIFSNEKLFEIAFSNEYQQEDTFLEMLEMGFVNLNTIFEGFFFDTWKYFTFEEKKPKTKPMTAKEKMIADMAKDGLDWNKAETWERNEDIEKQTRFVIKDINTPIYVYAVEELANGNIRHAKLTFPSIQELYNDDEFILDLLESDSFKGCKSSVLNWLRNQPSNNDLKMEFNRYDLEYWGSICPTIEEYLDDVVPLSEKEKLIEQAYNLISEGYDVDKNFFIEEIRSDIIIKDYTGVLRVGEVGVSGHDDGDGKHYAEISVYFPNKKEPSCSYDTNFYDLSKDTIKHILANMHK